MKGSILPVLAEEYNVLFSKGDINNVGFPEDKHFTNISFHLVINPSLLNIFGTF